MALHGRDPRGAESDGSAVTEAAPEQWKRIRHLADELIATCEPFKFNDELSELPLADCQLLDTMALECGCCNQWYDASDMTDRGSEFVCKDCK